MDDVRDLLIETFEAHQPPTPDSFDILSNVDAIAKARRRSRWALRATGVSLLSAGIVAGSLGVSGLVSHRAGHAIQVGTDGSGTPTPGDGSTPTEAQALAAYFDAGYDYTDAEKLAKIWNEPNKWPTKVKAEAGQKLLAGQTLPVQPSGTAATPEDKNVQAFFNAGYDYNDAVTLGNMWNESPYQAKIDGGKKLAAGVPLPIQPSGGTDASGAATPSSTFVTGKKARMIKLAKAEGKVWAASKPADAAGGGSPVTPVGNQAEFSAYFDAGYTYQDAVKLGRIWNQTDISQVKADAGQKLLDGDTLPVKPSGTPAPPEDLAVSAFFNAGYDYNDAVKLGQLWNETPSQAKIDGGKKLESGQSLPIQPRQLRLRPFNLRAGFELELLAPPGSSRRALADDLARRYGGAVRTVWHQDSEPAPIASLGGRFLHLTQGFEVTRGSGEVLCTVVDDITIKAGLNPAAAAPAGWIRVLTDDVRLLQLLANTSDPAASVEHVLDGAAAIWHAKPELIGNIWRLDTAGATVALAMPAGGERERPCEIVTPPIAADHEERLAELLKPAAELGFTVPAEAAVHIHVDGAPFRAAPALANVVRLFGYWRDELRAKLGTNPNCTRLAALPQPLLDAVSSDPTMDELRAAATAGALSKFFDVNLTQVLTDKPLRDTVEIRILPGSLDAASVVEQAAVVEGLLARCLDPAPIAPPTAGTDPII